MLHEDFRLNAVSIAATTRKDTVSVMMEHKFLSEN